MNTFLLPANQKIFRPGVILVGLFLILVSIATHADQAPANLAPGVQQVLKLSQARMGDDVITSFIHNSSDTYKLSADDVLYLSGQGVSQAVIAALLQKSNGQSATAAAPTPVQQTPVVSQQAAVPTAPVSTPSQQVLPPGGQPPVYSASATPPQVEVAPAGSAVDMNLFQAQLVPYGRWVEVAPYGLCWVPSIQNSNPDWRPYFNGGHWQYTDSGWYWASDYPWGELVFHYGRWTRTAMNGWVWVPGYQWGPAWVCWRNAEAEGYCGWAPLPPGAVFQPTVGIMWNGQVATDVDFGLAPDMFVFVPFDHFWVNNYVPWGAPYHRVPFLFRSSVVINGYGFVGGHFVIGGLGRDRIVLRTHHDIAIVHVGFGYHDYHGVPEHRVIEHERVIERRDRHDRLFR